MVPTCCVVRRCTDPVLCLSRHSSVGIVTRLLTAMSGGFVRLPLIGAGVFVSYSTRPGRLGAHTWGAGGGGGRLITHGVPGAAVEG